LEHILRSASKIAADPDVVVVGSQAILGSYKEDVLPERAHASIEADVTFLGDHDNDKSDVVDMFLGEDSHFHSSFGYYAQGVSVEVARLPTGWRERLVSFTSEATLGATGHCLEPHDLVISKLVAGRPKDLEFADALLSAGLIDPDILLERAHLLEVPVEARRVAAWVTSWVRKHHIT
jgi:hypothetical protein